MTNEDTYCLDTDDCSLLGEISSSLVNYNYSYPNNKKYCYANCSNNTHVHYVDN